jgi:hypothetical protein
MHVVKVVSQVGKPALQLEQQKRRCEMQRLLNQSKTVNWRF